MSIFSQQEIALIQSTAAQAEKDRKLSPQVIDVLYSNKILKLFITKELGGREEPLPQALKVFEDCAFVDGTIGWLAAIGSGGNYFAGYYSKEVASQLFSAPNAVLAGSGYPGTATPTEGGYIINGSWKYCSGAGFATFYTATAADDSGVIKAFTFMPQQVAVVQDWDAFGLKATESHTITVNNAFVPHHLVFDLAKPPISFSHYPACSFDFLLFARFSFAAVVLGLSKAFLQAAKQQRGYYSGDAARAHFITQAIETEETTLATLEQQFYQAAQQTWDTHCQNKVVPPADIYKAADSALALSQNASRLAGNLFPHLGMAVAMESNTLNRIYRNLLTANQHILLRKY